MTITCRSFASPRQPGCGCEECLLQLVRGRLGRAVKFASSARARKLVTRRITSTVREILWPLRGHHPECVFTFVADRNRDGAQARRALSHHLQRVKSHWRYLRKRAGVTDFRFHDFRHDFGTKLLRETGNLKLVQKALGHANLKTTSRYAHVLDDEVAEAMERVAKSRTKVPNKVENRKLMPMAQGSPTQHLNRFD